MRPELREALLDQLNKWLQELCTVDDEPHQLLVAQKHSKKLGFLTLSELYGVLVKVECLSEDRVFTIRKRELRELLRPVLTVALSESKSRLAAHTGEMVWDIPGPGVTCLLDDPILEQIEG